MTVDLALISSRPKWMDKVGAFIAVSMMFLEIFITVAPYLGYIPIGDASVSATQQQTITTVFIGIVAFFFGATVGNRAKDDAISSLSATTASQAAQVPKV